MKHQKSFYSGMGVAFFLVATGFILWFGLQMTQVMPMVKMNPQSKDFKPPSRYKVVKTANTLERLYHLSKFFGMNVYASRSIGAAGKVLSLREDQASKLQAKYYFLKSIEEAEYVAKSKDSLISKKGDRMEPLFEAYLKYSVFLNNSGERKMARRTLRKAEKLVKMTNKNVDQKRRDIQHVVHKLNLKSI